MRESSPTRLGGLWDHSAGKNAPHAAACAEYGNSKGGLSGSTLVVRTCNLGIRNLS